MTAWAAKSATEVEGKVWQVEGGVCCSTVKPALIRRSAMCYMAVHMAVFAAPALAMSYRKPLDLGRTLLLS